MPFSEITYMTLGDLKEWTKAANTRATLHFRELERQAWLIGYACTFAIGASLSPQNKYLTLAEMFPDPADAAEDDEDQEEHDAGYWQRQRTELISDINAD